MRSSSAIRLVALALWLSEPTFAAATEIKTLDEAKAAAAASGKLVLVQGTADW